VNLLDRLFSLFSRYPDDYVVDSDPSLPGAYLAPGELAARMEQREAEARARGEAWAQEPDGPPLASLD